MNELSTLRTLRSEVPGPTRAQLEAAGTALGLAMNAAQADPTARQPRRGRWVVAAAAAVVVATLVAGNISLSTQTVQADAILQQIAGVTVTYIDPQPGPGEYLLATTRANWPVNSVDAQGSATRTAGDQVIQVYQPADPGTDWVLYRDNGDGTGSTADGSVELLRAPGGAFYCCDATGARSNWLSQDIASIPTGSAAEALAYFDAQYTGGSSSRDEDTFGRITALLVSGLVPAPTRALLYDALALIPGVTATPGVANLDGATGVAIGRVEWLRGGERQEIIVDPATGLVIGNRAVSTLALFGYGFNEVMWSTAITTTVAATAP